MWLVLRDNGTGERLRAARKDAGVTQSAVAAELGVTIRTIQNYEAGRPIPDHNLFRLSVLFGRSARWLRTGTDAEPPPIAEAVAALRRQRGDLADNLRRLNALRGEMRMHRAAQALFAPPDPPNARGSA